jgi:molybdenum storage protein
MGPTEGDRIGQRLIESALPSQSLSNLDVIEFSHTGQEIRIIPDVNVIKIGGQSIMDRGRVAVYPLLEEIVANKERHKMILGTGGGTRSRHAYSLAIELDMPTGVVAKLGASVSRQNARLIAMLLAKDGGVVVDQAQFEMLPLLLANGCLPIIHGMPPYEYWERPPSKGRVPENRTDVGIYLMAEVLGARSAIFVKDEDGLYTDDPKKNPRAKFIPKISVRELKELDLTDVVIERKLVDLLEVARHVTHVQIINGLKKGRLTEALDGKHVGTIIYAET